MQVSDCVQIVDIAVGLDITHTFVGDLIITLESPEHSIRTIWGQLDCSENDIFAVLDDDGATPVQDECAVPAPAVSGVFSPFENLAPFNGETGNGEWVLKVSDNASGDIGTLNDWSLDIVCYAPEVISCNGFESCLTE